MKIIIAGSGCAKCKATEEAVRKICESAGFPAEIEHVYDPRETAKLGVMITPAIVIDGKVAMAGKVPTAQDVKKLLDIA